MSNKQIVLDCLNLYCFAFTVSALFSYFWHEQPKIELAALIAGAFTVGRLLRLMFTGRAVLPAESANG